MDDHATAPTHPGPPPAPAWAPWVLVAGIGTVLGFVLWTGRGVLPDVQVSASEVHVNARGYGHTITTASIDSVTFRSNLDGIGQRKTATQSGNTYLGSFEMSPYGIATLFVDALRKPYVVVHAGDDVTIISARDSAAAMALATTVERAASAAHRPAQVGSVPR